MKDLARLVEFNTQADSEGMQSIAFSYEPTALGASVPGAPALNKTFDI